MIAMKKPCIAALLAFPLASAASSEIGSGVVWKHLSTKNGDLPPPNAGTQQTFCIVLDIDKDGIAEGDC